MMNVESVVQDRSRRFHSFGVMRPMGGMPVATATLFCEAGRVVGGVAEEALVTHWRRFRLGQNPDPDEAGAIIRRVHELRGQSFKDRDSCISQSHRGSSGWSAAFHLARLTKSAPKAMIFNIKCQRCDVRWSAMNDARALGDQSRPGCAHRHRNRGLGEGRRRPGHRGEVIKKRQESKMPRRRCFRDHREPELGLTRIKQSVWSPSPYGSFTFFERPGRQPDRLRLASYFRKDYHLTTSQTGNIFALHQVVHPAGRLSSSPTSRDPDRAASHRESLATAAFGVFTMCFYFAQAAYYTLSALRLIDGFPLGGMLPLRLGAQHPEYAPKRYRSTIVTVIMMQDIRWAQP